MKALHKVLEILTSNRVDGSLGQVGLIACRGNKASKANRGQIIVCTPGPFDKGK